MSKKITTEETKRRRLMMEMVRELGITDANDCTAR